MKKARSFKKELISSFLTITFFSIALLGIFQIYQLNSLINENQKSQAQTTKYLSDYIRNYVLEHKKAIQTESLTIREKFINQDIEGIHTQLKNIKTNYPGFVNLYVGNIKGQSIVFYPEVYTDGVKRENLNFSDRSYYKELLKTKNTVISPALPGRGGTDILLVTIVSPIMNDKGEMIGYVLGALDLNALGEHIQNRTFGDGGQAVVIDAEKNVIVHPEIETRKKLVNLSKSEVTQYIEKQREEEGSNFFKNANNNDEVYITYEKIQPLGWTVWITKPTDMIMKTYKNAIMLILFFLLLTAILMIGVSLFLTNRLERSIHQLLNYIKDYTIGFKRKKTVVKKITGPKEMEELYFYFNNMIQEVEKNRNGLMELNRELEGRVQERTAVLEHKNSELKAVNKLITSVSSNKDLAHFIQHCLKEIEPFLNYSIHVFFMDLAVTNKTIITTQNLLQYLSENMTGEQQYMEPIQIEQKNKGFLIVDLDDDQSIKTSDQEFLHTFASSLAVMLQNKFLFEQIRNKHAVLEAVLESMSEGLMLLNNQNEVEYVNEFFLKIMTTEEDNDDDNDYGYNNSLVSLEDVSKRFITLFDVQHEDLSAFFANEIEELKLEDKNSKKPNYYLLHKFSVMLDENIIGEGLVLRDITKEEEIDTLKNNLISLTSHEFKTPITNIKGSVETLLRSEVEWEPEFQQELLEGVHEDIERILHLVNDWMDISKIGSGTMYVERNMIRADHVITKSMEQIPLSLKENAYFEFHNKLREGYTFYADKLRIQQVLVNLFTNALRYNDSIEKKIDITLGMELDFITISVSDNGIGISPDHLTKIFNRFYQVDVTATRRTGGTGLGLSICLGIMEAHGGKIEVKSELGKGSTFILYFPITRGGE
ncbi:sensor histidine kinase [Bacillus sp. S/N-304-OC-R1]|uniref:sensor histidine kinase n=1 Tax=Bacillus sp. S/N-304-OC-R1 TaxID=2758034 RepID=UPI001C8E1BFD|nr:sensor histidine kinase [Bacillus sp. S/N-304-OC-R1]MBY0121246.1 Cache 3/Cache 2 fusion domain-containing protein [Bacillus sp. S/N-304-OC-R1]